MPAPPTGVAITLIIIARYSSSQEGMLNQYHQDIKMDGLDLSVSHLMKIDARKG